MTEEKKYIMLIPDYCHDEVVAWQEELAKYGIDWSIYCGRVVVFTMGNLEESIEAIHRLGVPGRRWSWLSPEGRLLTTIPAYVLGDKEAISSIANVTRSIERGLKYG